MTNEFNIKEWLDNIYKVQTAVRIAIVPPWKISDVKGHPAVNLGSLAIASILYLIMRQFTPAGDFGLSEVGILIALVLLFLFGCGVVVNFFDPSANAAKLSNRWSTFMIISFFYSIIFLILASVTVPLFSGFQYNFFDVLSTLLGGSRAGWTAATLFATISAFGALYWRTYWWFRQILRQNARFLGVALLFCAAVNWAILFVLLFVI